LYDSKSVFMYLKKNSVFISFLFTIGIVSAQNQEVDFSNMELKSLDWNPGISIQNNDKSFRFKWGGRIQYDHAFFRQNKELDRQEGKLASGNGTEFRRVWLSNAGTFYQNTDFGINVSFEGGRVAFRGVYLKLRNLPWAGNLKVGQIKEPHRLEVLISSNHLLFLERTASVDFAPIFNSGLMVYNDFFNEKLSAQVGFFRNAHPNNANDLIANGGFNVTGRITGLPLQSKEATLHIGSSYSYRKPGTGTYQVASSGAAHLSRKKYLDTDVLEVGASEQLNFEFLFVRGPFFIQSEYLTSRIQKRGVLEEIVYLRTAYSQISYCLTGEKRSYKSSLAGPNPLLPRHNFDRNHLGAWELALRYAAADFNDGSVSGGKQQDLTLGLNWYLNPAVKVMANKVWTTFEFEKKLAVFEFRMQLAF
jgi:phosphate-selective porin OprO/OprP